ncbi:MAG: hypothetical protein LBD32_01705, partial [Cytophagales bacterium]|nr:hypothetical protein [Cytophagales bacterium]
MCILSLSVPNRVYCAPKKNAKGGKGGEAVIPAEVKKGVEEKTTSSELVKKVSGSPSKVSRKNLREKARAPIEKKGRKEEKGKNRDKTILPETPKEHLQEKAKLPKEKRKRINKPGKELPGTPSEDLQIMGETLKEEKGGKKKVPSETPKEKLEGKPKTPKREESEVIEE